MRNLQTFNGFSEINEKGNPGIHPAIRQKLLDFIKNNPKCSYEEARDHISSKMKNWNLSKDDFLEACKISKKTLK